MKRLLRLLVAGAVLPVWMWAPARPAARPAWLPASATYAVNNAADTPDADQGDGVCADTLGRCTLRAAIMQANFATGPNTITVPSGVYLLTRAGLDNMAFVGDLDITDELTILGAGPAKTVVDGNGAVTGDRVFEVLSTAHAVALSGLTIRNGDDQTTSGGGGLSMHAGDLQLSDVAIENNTSGGYGGGLFGDYTAGSGSMALERLVVRNNSGQRGGGLGALEIGLFFSQVTVRDSQIYSNTATFDYGGGIGIVGDTDSAGGDWHIQDSQIYSNAAEYGAGIFTPFSSAFRLTVDSSSLHDNQAFFAGGAIENGAALVVSQTTVAANSAIINGSFGGGISSASPTSVVTISQSTLSGNSAMYGGGLYLGGSPTGSVSTLINSTLSGNTAAKYGAGIFALSGPVQLFNSTIAGNQVVVPLHAQRDSGGGGLYITSTAVVSASNLLLADNSTRIGLNLPAPDDCFGPLVSRGFNLIQTPDNCLVSGATSSNITGQDPLLGPLANQGGATQTRALLAGSPAIDAGQHPCMDAHGTAILMDQRGFARPGGANCDMGAFEYYPPGPFLPLVLR